MRRDVSTAPARDGARSSPGRCELALLDDLSR